MSEYKDRDMDYEEHKNKYHDIRVERRNKKKKARRKRILAVVIILGVIAAAFATKELWMPRLADFFEDSKETIINDGTPQTGNGFPIELSHSEYNYISAIESYPTVISDTHITMYNEKGGIYKKIQHLFANPVYYTMEDRIFVYDLDGYNFALYDKKGEVFSKKTEDEIVVASVSDKKMVAVVTQTDKYASYLTIYDENGDAVFKWSGGQRIVNVAFNKEETGCIVSTFSSSGGKLVSKLYGFEFDKTTEVFKTSDLEGLVYQSGYCENGDMWLVGDEKFYRVASDGSVIYTYQYDRELAAFDMNRNVAALVFDSVTGDRQEVRIFSEGKEPAVYQTDGKVVKLEAVDGEVAIMTDSLFAFLDAKAKITASAEIEKEYSGFYVIGDKAYFMGYNEVDRVDFDR